MKIETIIEDLSSNDNKINYYYKQGFEIGKEEQLYLMINKMFLNNIDINTISKITNLSLDEINSIISQN